MKKYSFNTAYTQARELYGITVNPDEFETLGLIAWDKIGNKQHRLYKLTDKPLKNKEGAWYIDLPCNCDIIESVTADYEDYQNTTNFTVSGGNNQSGWIEDFIEHRKFNESPLHTSGKFIKYSQVNNRLFLDEFKQVNVLYKGILADEEGLPFLNVKEISAISSFIAWADTRKKALVSRDANLMNFANLLQVEWKNLCTQARVPEYINQNEMDQILNVATSWDRKRFGKSFKPIH